MESPMNETFVYLSITKGKERLVIDGSFELFKNFMTTFTQDAPQITAPASLSHPTTIYKPITEEAAA